MLLTNTSELSNSMVHRVAGTLSPVVEGSPAASPSTPPAAVLPPPTLVQAPASNAMALPTPAPSGFRAAIAERLRGGQRDLYVSTYNAIVAQRISSTYGADGAFNFNERWRASNAFSKLLDTQGLAVFVHELDQLAVDSKVQGFLTDLRAQLAAATPERPVELWTLALKHAGSRDEAIRWLAVLLQDYSPRAHTAGGSVSVVRDIAARESLRATIIAIADAESKGTLAPFPSGANSDGAHFYHYYVPAYLAQRMVKNGVQPDLAFLSAATFNLEYEILRPALFVARQKEAIAAITPSVAKAFGRPLEGKVQELRAAGRVDATFTTADLDLVSDLALEPKQIAAILAKVGSDNELLPESKAFLASNSELTMNIIGETVAASDSRTMAQNMKGEAWSALLGQLFSSRRIINDFMNNGARDPIALSAEDAAGTYAGFAGAALVLPEGAPPLPREQLMNKVLANPTGAMRELFASRLEPPPSQDATYAALAAKLGRDGAQASIAVIDPKFNTSAPKGGWDFIDNDSDPGTRSLHVLHGTPVLDLAKRGTPAIAAIPLRADLGHILSAIDYAAARGAKCVVISQDMVADSAAGQQAFRDALRRHPELLVVVASGNSGKPLGVRSHELATVNEPNLVVVAAATATRRVSPLSNFGPAHVRFAMRGGTMDPGLWKESTIAQLETLHAGLTRPDGEASSHAAPAFGNLYMKVGLLAPELSLSEVLEVIATTAHIDDATRARVRNGIPDHERAERLAALTSLVRRGSTPEEAAARLGLSRDTIDDYSRFKRALP